MFSKSMMEGFLAQAKGAQEKIKQEQEEFAKEVFEGQAGGDLVSIKINGNHQVKDISLSDVTLSDKDMLEDLLLSAFNSALENLENAKTNKFSNLKNQFLPEGFDIPGL